MALVTVIITKEMNVVDGIKAEQTLRQQLLSAVHPLKTRGGDDPVDRNEYLLVLLVVQQEIVTMYFYLFQSVPPLFLMEFSV